MNTTNGWNGDALRGAQAARIENRAALLSGGWSPGHAVRKKGVGQDDKKEDTPVLSSPVVGLAVNGLTAVGSGFLVAKTEGVVNTISWVVLIITSLRTLNDLASLREGA